MGLVTDTDITNKNYKMLYKASLSEKNHIEYIIDIYEEEFNEQLIEEFLNNRSNKRSILKTILVDKSENEDTDTSEITPGMNDTYDKESKFIFYLNI